MMNIEDRALVIRLKEGDKIAFKLLFERYYPVFISFARRMLKDESTAEDLVQNVFMKIWVGRSNIDEDRSFRNYLLVSMRNEVYQYFRYAFRMEGEVDCVEVEDGSVNVEVELSARELEKNISSVVSQMPPRRREIFDMSRYEKLSNREIAQRLGLSVRTVEKHIENALADIRKHIPVSVLVIVMTLW